MTKKDIYDLLHDFKPTGTSIALSEIIVDSALEQLADIIADKIKQQWIPVSQKLPELYKCGLSHGVLTVAVNRIRVNCYDYNLRRWTGSPHVTITHWQPLPPNPDKP